MDNPNQNNPFQNPPQGDGGPPQQGGNGPGQGFGSPPPQGNFQPGPAGGAPLYPGGPQQSQGLAIASMVLGIISLVTFCLWFVAIPMAILAIVLGGIHLQKVNKLPVQTGKGMAIAGLVCGLIAIAIAVAIAIFALTVGSELENELEDISVQLEQNLEEIENQ